MNADSIDSNHLLFHFLQTLPPFHCIFILTFLHAMEQYYVDSTFRRYAPTTHNVIHWKTLFHSECAFCLLATNKLNYKKLSRTSKITTTTTKSKEWILLNAIRFATVEKFPFFYFVPAFVYTSLVCSSHKQ